MTHTTGLERGQLVIHGERAELRLEDGRITIAKQSPTQAAPTTITVEVGEVRSVDLEAPSRGRRGWLHLAVIGGSPAPPTELAAAGDPYTVPITARALAGARRLQRLVDKHVKRRGMPSESGPNRGSYSSGVSLTDAPVTPRPEPGFATTTPTGGDDPDVATQLHQLDGLRDAGVLTDDEFARARSRLLG